MLPELILENSDNVWFKKKGKQQGLKFENFYENETFSEKKGHFKR